MIRRLPIRIRLAAAFTATMAAVLLGVGVGTVAHARASLDDSITESLSYRLGDLVPVATNAAPLLPGGSRDTAEQVLDRSGQIIASSPEIADQPVLGPSELAAAGRGQLRGAEHTTAGKVTGPVRLAASPVDGDRIAVAVVSLADRDTAVADLRQELQIAFPLVLLAAAVGAYLLAGAALRPVERMRARAATLTAEDPEQRLPVPVARDEISRLGATFNDLLARLQAALSRERQFVADASHELRTPLSLLTTELELALRRPRTAQELTTALHSALEETGRLSRLAQDLLLLARTDHDSPPEQHATVTELRPLLDSVLARHRTTLGAHDVILDCAPDLAVWAGTEDLDRAVNNLIDNASLHGSPPIIITAGPSGPGEPTVALEVRDHGPGFDPGFLPRAFDRFTRADSARTRGGTGLGLAIVAALARRHGGRVSAANHPDGGTTLTLTLPAAPAPIRASR